MLVVVGVFGEGKISNLRIASRFDWQHCSLLMTLLLFPLFW